jgi:hypothetical protein
VRTISTLTFLVALALLASPAVAGAQSFELSGSAGPTITDTGNSFAAGVGYSPTSRMTIVFNVERTHLASRTSREGAGVSSFRGGTLLLGTTELRVTPFGRDRFGPFVVVGLARGVSHPNVNQLFPHRVTNDVRGMFAGGGVRVPLSERLAVFAEARMMIGAEGNEGMVGVAPMRAGVTWQF